jgi:hypothetical protein
MEFIHNAPYKPAPYPDIQFRSILYHGNGQLWIARLYEGANVLTGEEISNTSPQAAEDLDLLSAKFRGLANKIPGWHSKVHDQVVTKTKIAGAFRAHRGITPMATYDVQRRIVMVIRQVAQAQAEVMGPEYSKIEESSAMQIESLSQ